MDVEISGLKKLVENILEIVEDRVKTSEQNDLLMHISAKVDLQGERLNKFEAAIQNMETTLKNIEKKVTDLSDDKVTNEDVTVKSEVDATDSCCLISRSEPKPCGSVAYHLDNEDNSSLKLCQNVHELKAFIKEETRIIADMNKKCTTEIKTQMAKANKSIFTPLKAATVDLKGVLNRINEVGSDVKYIENRSIRNFHDMDELMCFVKNERDTITKIQINTEQQHVVSMMKVDKITKQLDSLQKQSKEGSRQHQLTIEQIVSESQITRKMLCMSKPPRKEYTCDFFIHNIHDKSKAFGSEASNLWYIEAVDTYFKGVVKFEPHTLNIWISQGKNSEKCGLIPARRSLCISAKVYVTKESKIDYFLGDGVYCDYGGHLSDKSIDCWANFDGCCLAKVPIEHIVYNGYVDERDTVVLRYIITTDGWNHSHYLK